MGRVEHGGHLLAVGRSILHDFRTVGRQAQKRFAVGHESHAARCGGSIVGIDVSGDVGGIDCRNHSGRSDNGAGKK